MKVIINNIEYPYVPGSVSITDKLNSRSTASAVILHGTSTHFSRGTQVTIKDDYDVVQFYGFISPRESIELDMNTLRTEIECVDAHYLVDKRTITATYTSQAAGTTVSAIITAVLAAEGITAGTIEAGPTLPLLDFKSTKVNSALQDMAEAISFIWWVDSNKQLHFRLPGSQTAPWDLVWENVRVGTLKVIRESPEYKNRVRVRSASTSVVSNSATEQTRLAAIEGSSGIVEDVLEGPGYSSDTSAQTAADGVITGYAVEETVIEFQTRKSGLAIGQTLTVRLAEHNLDGTAFLIMSVGMHEEHALDVHGAVYSVRAVVGPTSMAWANRISRLVSRGEATARLYDSIVAAPVQTFVASGVGAVPSGAKLLEYHIFGGGGGGGSGARDFTTLPCQGGGGGAQGGYTHGVIDASLVGSTFTVTIGAGGGGGAAIGSSTVSSGNDGTAGGDSAFFNFKALGGQGGQGGQRNTTGSTTAKLARAATSHGVSVLGSAPGRGSDVAGESVTDQVAQALPCAGGGGGGMNSSASHSGGTGGTWSTQSQAWTTTRARTGANGDNQVTALFGGQGGSGGASTIVNANATAGGTGGFPGGGGGGGGARDDSAAKTSGAGGAGGAGLVVVIAY